MINIQTFTSDRSMPKKSQAHTERLGNKHERSQRIALRGYLSPDLSQLNFKVSRETIVIYDFYSILVSTDLKFIVASKPPFPRRRSDLMREPLIWGDQIMGLVFGTPSCLLMSDLFSLARVSHRMVKSLGIHFQESILLRAGR